MSELLGADTHRLDLVAEGLQGSFEVIQNLRATAQRAVAEMRNAWGGPDFERLAQRWDQETGPCLVDVSSALGAMATLLRAQAAEQRRTSGNTAGSSVPMVSSHVPMTSSQSGSLGSLASPSLAGPVRLNLAESEVTVFEASMASIKGGGSHYEYELSAAKVEVEGASSVDFDAGGNLVASASVSAAAYAGYAMGALRGGNDFASITAQGKAYAGAEASADASASIGRDGAGGRLGVEAFLGGKVEGSLGGKVAGVTAMAGAEISYGIGAHAEVETELCASNVGFSAEIGAALGVGTGVAVDVSVDPREVIAIVGHVAEGVSERLTLAGDQMESW